MPYSTILSHSGGVGQSWPSKWGTTGTLGIFCDTGFVADDGKTFQPGNGDDLDGEFIAQVSITVSGGIPIYAAFALPKTDLATPANVPRFYGRHFDAHDAPRDFHFENFHMRSSLGNSLTYLAWVIDNQQRYRPQLDTYPTTNQMNAAIQAALANAPAGVIAMGLATLPGGGVPVAIAEPLTALTSAIEGLSVSNGVVGRLYATDRVPGVGFTMNSDNGGDAGDFIWFIKRFL